MNLPGEAGGPLGPVDIRRATNNAEGCRGWANARPSHIIYVQSPARYLRAHVQSTTDTTLVIRRPDGTFLCDDDTNGTNPQIEINPWPAGEYRIWVGTYARSNQTRPYRLYFTRQRP